MNSLPQSLIYYDLFFNFYIFIFYPSFYSYKFLHALFFYSINKMINCGEPSLAQPCIPAPTAVIRNISLSAAIVAPSSLKTAISLTASFIYIQMPVHALDSPMSSYCTAHLIINDTYFRWY